MTKTFPCRGPECRSRVGKKDRLCIVCAADLKGMLGRLNEVLHRPRPPHTPRVVSVLKPGR